ncbi:MAG: hypothetical protein J0J04_08105 [Microbacterium sp.]|uniref:hypothetical protein n=1 Tax=Microbacterium sp. TaxID=51671 RepID=UPI001AC0590E|nr:hypothetical protein [Microbacterium sp.]MBN9214763.1 hypothetical protein [Microbacterium sp.]
MSITGRRTPRSVTIALIVAWAVALFTWPMLTLIAAATGQHISHSILPPDPIRSPLPGAGAWVFIVAVPLMAAITCLLIPLFVGARRALAWVLAVIAAGVVGVLAIPVTGIFALMLVPAFGN